MRLREEVRNLKYEIDRLSHEIKQLKEPKVCEACGCYIANYEWSKGKPEIRERRTYSGLEEQIEHYIHYSYYCKKCAKEVSNET